MEFHGKSEASQMHFPTNRFFIAHSKVVLIIRVVRTEDKFKETNAGIDGRRNKQKPVE